MSDRALSILVHGLSKVGKTTFSVTSPYPRLLLDVEAASRFIQVNKIKWDPLREAPPVADGTWDTCVVAVRDFDTALKAYEWLNSGKHQFKSVIVDSISELQSKAMEAVAGRRQMQTQDWGELLRRVAFFCRDLRDLTTHESNPLEAVVITAMSRNVDNMLRPGLQGSIASQIPYLFDICAYMYADQVHDPATGEVTNVRRLLTRKHPSFEAGERVQGLIPEIVDNPNVEQMLDDVFGPRPEAAAPVATSDTDTE